MRRLVPLGISLAFWAGVLGACGKDNAAIERGGECSFATDCAPGLVCVEQKKTGTRICTDDLTGVEGEPPDQGGGDASDEGGEGGPTEGGVTDAPVVTDTGTDQGVVDTGVDTGPPPADAGDEG